MANTVPLMQRFANVIRQGMRTVKHRQRRNNVPYDNHALATESSDALRVPSQDNRLGRVLGETKSLKIYIDVSNDTTDLDEIDSTNISGQRKNT